MLQAIPAHLYREL